MNKYAIHKKYRPGRKFLYKHREKDHMDMVLTIDRVDHGLFTGSLVVFPKEITGEYFYIEDIELINE